MQIVSIFGHTCRTVAGSLKPHIPPCQSMGLGACADDFHIWAHLSHCRRLSQAPYPHTNTQDWVYMQMISIFGHTCRTVAGSLRPHIPPCQSMGLGACADDFHIWAHLSHCRRPSPAPYTPMPVALSQALSDPILSCQDICK